MEDMNDMIEVIRMERELNGKVKKYRKKILLEDIVSYEESESFSGMTDLFLNYGALTVEMSYNAFDIMLEEALNNKIMRNI